MVRMYLGNTSANRHCDCCCRHSDNLSKLTRYGFPLNMWSDGCSRTVIGLAMMSSNSCAAEVAERYVDIVASLGFTSEIMAVDPGTANNIMTVIHALFACGGAAGSIQVSHSHRNIVAEINNGKVGFAVIFALQARFTQLEVQGWFVHTIPVYTLFMRAVMFEFVSEQHLDWMHDWNAHPIRKQKRLVNAGRPWGRVDIMYNHPEKFGLVDVRVPVPSELIIHARTLIQEYRDQSPTGPPSVIALAEALPEAPAVRMYATTRKSVLTASKGSPLDIDDLIDLYKDIVVHFGANHHVLNE
jgi:hypothetical protein